MPRLRQMKSKKFETRSLGQFARAAAATNVGTFNASKIREILRQSLSPLNSMPQVDFGKAFAEESVPPTVHSTSPPATEFDLPEEAHAFIEPSRFRVTRLGRSEWANVLFAVLAIAGGLFCAFYFFNGADLVRAALARPGEYLYPRPVPSGQHIALTTGALPEEAPLSETLADRRSSKTDPSGDPFSHASKLITLDRPTGSFPRGGGGLTVGSLSPVLSPPVSGSPAIPVAGLAGGLVGGLPGPGTLISRLTLLLPGGDALTQALRRAPATVPLNFILTLRHDASRGRGAETDSR